MKKKTEHGFKPLRQVDPRSIFSTIKTLFLNDFPDDGFRFCFD